MGWGGVGLGYDTLEFIRRVVFVCRPTGLKISDVGVVCIFSVAQDSG